MAAMAGCRARLSQARAHHSHHSVAPCSVGPLRCCSLLRGSAGQRAYGSQMCWLEGGEHQWGMLLDKGMAVRWVPMRCPICHGAPFVGRGLFWGRRAQSGL